VQLEPVSLMWFTQVYWHFISEGGRVLPGGWWRALPALRPPQGTIDMTQKKFGRRKKQACNRPDAKKQAFEDGMMSRKKERPENGV
jgi:hypothetical protein